LLGGRSLPEREWDHANSHKQNQVKGASKKMRFDAGVSLFLHSNEILFSVLFSLLPGHTCFHALLPFIILLRDFSIEVLENLPESEKFAHTSISQRPRPAMAQRPRELARFSSRLCRF
jgi:hypothetical protein